MIAIYAGRPGTVAAIQHASALHAAWLGRPLRESRALLGDDIELYAAWDPDTTDDHYRYVCVCLPGERCQFNDRLGEHSSRVLVHFDVADGCLRAETRLSSAVQLQHARLEGGSWLLTDDIRLFRRVARWDLDPVGVYGLLKLGAIPAPYTILAGVQRVVPGDALSYDARTGELTSESPWRTMVAAMAHEPRATDVGQASERLIGAVDGALNQVEQGSVLLYSGGVDSSLLAARLAALDRRDVRLAHLEFEHLPDDTRLARELADHLGLEMVSRQYDPNKAGEILEVTAREWPYPYVGPSAVPTHVALELGMSLGSKVLVEGTASEVLAAKTLRWQERRGIRSWLMAQAGRQYIDSGLWRLPLLHTLAPAALRARHRQARLPATVASLVPNALDGFAYRVPGDVQAALNRAVVGLTDGLPAGAESMEAMAVTSVGVRRAGRYIAKLVGPLSNRGGSCSHPFMTPAMISAALTSSGEWSRQHKPIFKAQLARQLPPELANRRPSAFVPPLGNMLGQVAVRRAALEAASRGQPLADYVDRRVVRQLLSDAPRQRSSIADAAGRWLWGLAFCHRWLKDTAFS